MSKKFEVIFYAKSDGTEPAVEFLSLLTKKLKAKIVRGIKLLQDYGNLHCEPHSKLLDNGIFELRIKHGSDIARILYFFMIGRKIIITNGFVKKGRKTPKKELLLANKYKADYIKREEIQ